MQLDAVIKIGGSVITDKRKPMTLNSKGIENITREIRKIKEKGYSTIIVHGAGSYGHPLAAKYKLHQPPINSKKYKGVMITREAVKNLNLHLTEILLNSGIPAFSLQTSSLISLKNGKLIIYGIEIVKHLLSHKLFPVLYGDVIIDEDNNFVIASGDSIAVELARLLEAEKLIFAADVDGIYYRTHGKSKLILQVPLSKLGKLKNIIGSSKGIDVTGGMYNKIIELERLKGSSVQEAWILNGFKSGRLCGAVEGRRVRGTLIRLT